MEESRVFQGKVGHAMPVKLGNVRTSKQPAFAHEIDERKGLRLVSADEALRILARRRAQHLDRWYLGLVISGSLLLLLTVL